MAVGRDGLETTGGYERHDAEQEQYRKPNVRI